MDAFFSRLDGIGIGSLGTNEGVIESGFVIFVFGVSLRSTKTARFMAQRKVKIANSIVRVERMRHEYTQYIQNIFIS